MRKRSSLPGGDLEHDVLAAVWKLGNATVREIYEVAGEPKGLVYTTIAKVLDRLYAKGLVTRRLSGNSFLYRARAKRATIQRAALKRALDRVLGPDPRPAIANLVDAVESIDPELLRQLSSAIDARRRQRRGS
ncbi:MAG: BlaI/MecI/CopY family transcriptional regulator [Acidobacteriota bacterium]|nr:BlaI/MecI/CopY family transcriptional regulator [Acidobacteriota bacterium]